MRICLIVDNSKPDEARKVITINLFNYLSKNHDVFIADLKNIYSFSFWLKIKKFSPDVVHYVPGASPLSFIICKILQCYLRRKPKIIISVLLHPFHGTLYSPYYALSYLLKWSIPLFKPDLLVVQTRDAYNTFKNYKIKLKIQILSGVDLQLFAPVSESKKVILRQKYNIDQKKSVILHVGSIRKWRSVHILRNILIDHSFQLIIVGRPSGKFEKEIADDLTKNGCILFNQYLQNINEIYALSDCYVFPTTTPIGSIDIPLSILEAMATNLPIISTEFGGLPEIFDEGIGFQFIKSLDEIDLKLKDLQKFGFNAKTRNMIMNFSWSEIGREIEKIYEDVILSP